MQTATGMYLEAGRTKDLRGQWEAGGGSRKQEVGGGMRLEAGGARACERMCAPGCTAHFRDALENTRAA
eukprot:7693981-Pyramimonas_sp.AAC.1